ncbi:MAG: ABC transporter permease, partial [Gemmatimonadetes bacterium]|nr:ABC transporter permease [Gemmatimonadota bacterium]
TGVVALRSPEFEALAAFRRAPVLTGLSAAMIALSLFVVGLFGVAAHNIRVVLDQVEARVEIVAYLRDDAPTEAVEALEAEITAMEQVREVIYVSRAQAMELARQQLRDFETIFTELDTNPFPASLEITLHPGLRSSLVVREIADRVRGYPFVEDVRFGQDWLDKVYLLRRVAAAAALVVGGAFAVVASLIISSAIRLAVFARRDEIAIMRMVGATNGFVRRPFLLEGLLTGALGSLLALPATYLVFRLLSDSVLELEWMPPSWVGLGLAAGAIFGVIASARAVRRHLQEI